MFKCMTEISEIFSGELVYANWAFSKSLPKKVSIQKSLYLQLYLCTNFSVLYKLTHSIVNELWNVNRNTAFCCVYEWMKKFHWLTQPTVSVTISTKVNETGTLTSATRFKFVLFNFKSSFTTKEESPFHWSNIKKWSIFIPDGWNNWAYPLSSSSKVTSCTWSAKQANEIHHEKY